MPGYYNFEDWEWDEERDTKIHNMWFLDKKETLRTRTFLDWWMLGHVFIMAFPCGTEYLEFPYNRGGDYRTKKGWCYISALGATEEERREREPRFRKKIAPWIDDFGKEYHKFVDELMARAAKIKAVDVEKATTWELKRAFEDWVEFYLYAAEVHFIWMAAYSVIFELFEDKCKQLLGIDRHDRLFNDVLAGVDTKMLQTDRGLWKLAKKAKEIGLEPIFEASSDDHEALKKLGEKAEGKEWLGQLRTFLDEYGWRTVGNWDCSNPTWVEDPSMSFFSIRTFMKQPEFAVDEHHQTLVKSREKAEKEILSRIPESEKGWFTKLLKAAQWTSIVNEEHCFYTESLGNALGRYTVWECGKRFAKYGLIDDAFDIYYLKPDEIDIRIINRFDARKTVKIRKEQHEEFRKVEPPLFIGDPNEIQALMGSDPVIRTAVAPIPWVRPELKADLYGTIAAPGVAEGVARVIMDEKDMGLLKPGEILVTLETSAAWTPVFGVVKGVITDVGGVLSHCAIVAREYGIPAVSGTMEGTQKITTGMKLRVDGDQGVVYILEK
jgi:phosphohistidine swiveling domain-containing protein